MHTHKSRQVILDKNKHIKTVVNKIGSIDATFRFFKMEIIAGEDCMQTQVRESGCVFGFDFSRVYWNSRLHTEHERLVRLMSRADVLCDMTGGVGPFALPAGKKGCLVYTNDLNPDSYKVLCYWRCTRTGHLKITVSSAVPVIQSSHSFSEWCRAWWPTSC